MKFFISTREHGLLPVAHRLRLEGHDVEVLVHKPKYRKAWGGKITTFGKDAGVVKPGDLGDLPERVSSGEFIGLVDQVSWTLDQFAGPKTHGVLDTQKPTTGFRAGGWFDGNHISAPHFLIYDMGAWTGGMGPLVPGGVTLVRDDAPDTEGKTAFREQLESELKARDFKGLFNVGLLEDPETGLKLDGMEAGWPFGQVHAFLSEVEGFGEVVSGNADPILPKKFVTVIPVSVPPWPNRGVAAESEIPIQGLTPQQVGHFFWHDMQVHQEHRELRTAGLDGLVGFARGAGQSPELARTRAVELAARVLLPAKQWRPDAGSLVPQVLAKMEEIGIEF